jgi:cob(I)alamin adenosyltransferase
LIVALGDLDELSSFLGLSRSFLKTGTTATELKNAQKNLHLLGAVVAGFSQAAFLEKLRREIKRLENLAKHLEEELPPLAGFIYPGGTEAAGFLFAARAVCRRAERSVWGLKRLDSAAGTYLNRLSDFLFLAARQVNHIAGGGDDLVTS